MKLAMWVLLATCTLTSVQAARRCGHVIASVVNSDWDSTVSEPNSYETLVLLVHALEIGEGNLNYAADQINAEFETQMGSQEFLSALPKALNGRNDGMRNYKRLTDPQLNLVLEVFDTSGEWERSVRLYNGMLRELKFRNPEGPKNVDSDDEDLDS